MKRDIRLLLIFFVIMAGMVGTGYYAWLKAHTPSTLTAPAFEQTGTKLIIGSKIIINEPAPLLREGQVLLAFDTVKNHIDPYLWWDANNNAVTVTTKNRVIRMETDKLDALVNDNPMSLSFPVIKEGDSVYLPIAFLADFYGITVSYINETDVVIVDFQNTAFRQAYPQAEGLIIRTGSSIQHPIVKTLTGSVDATENQMLVMEDYGEWYRVRCADGVFGFVFKNEVVVSEAMRIAKAIPKQTQQRLPPEKLTLAWEMMYSPTTAYLKRAPETGIDILSPTWFQVLDTDGNIVNRADPQYIEWAHTNGWQVWALFSNDFAQISNTSTILNDPAKRQNVIRQMLAYVALYQLDGINIDFENIFKADKDALTQFVRELTPLLREQGLTVSMDITAPGGSDNWSLCFDRPALAETVDYLFLMAYDQHWASSPVAGSTAEAPWVEDMLNRTLLEVPAEKLMLGIPLYTRLWRTNGSSVKAIKALGTDTAWKTAKDNNATITWDEEKGQYHAVWQGTDGQYDIWIEDANAVNVKSALVHKYNLAGAGAWAMNFAGEGIWNIFSRNLQEVKHYDEWVSTIGSTPTPR